MDGALDIFPALETAEIRTFVNGPESFTPDGFPYISFAKEVKHIFFYSSIRNCFSNQNNYLNLVYI